MKRRSSGSFESLVEVPEGEGLISSPAPDEEKGAFVADAGGFIDGVEEDEEDCGEDELCSPRGVAGSRGSGAGAGGAGSEKKRRLSTEQVKALERNFEVENKLEPERKVRLAQELGLQPRQVAVWFQNRRARWKTKQLERDYALLKSNYDTLQMSFDNLRTEHQALLDEMKDLRSKLEEGVPPRSNSTATVKDEPAASESDKVGFSEAEEEVIEQEAEAEVDEKVLLPPLIYKDGSSADSSDSSAVLNTGEDNVSPRHHSHHRDAGAFFPASTGQQQLPGPPLQPMAVFDFSKCHSSPPPFYHYTHQQTQQHQQQHLHHPVQSQQLSFSSSPPLPPLMVRMVEEHNFLLGDEPCSGSFFSDEQLPTMPWYCSDQWN